MADLAKRLDQVVGGLAVVFDDQQAHRDVGWLTAGWLSVNMVRSPSACKASDHSDTCKKKRAAKLGDSTALPFRRRGAYSTGR